MEFSDLVINSDGELIANIQNSSDIVNSIGEDVTQYEVLGLTYTYNTLCFLIIKK